MSNENLIKIQENKQRATDLMRLVFNQAALLNARDAAIEQYKEDISDNIKIFKQEFPELKPKDFNKLLLIARKSEVVYSDMQDVQVMFDMADAYMSSISNE